MGLLARGIEAQGLPTTFVGVMLDILKIIRPPRAAFADFPIGRPFGRPHDRPTQMAVLRDVLALLETARQAPTLAMLPYEWGEPFDFVPGRRRQKEE